MASTLKDFFNSAIERARGGADGAYDWMKKRTEGLRAGASPASATPGVSDITPEVEARASAAEGAYNSKVNAFNERAGMRGATVRPTPDMGSQVFDDVRLQKEYGPQGGVKSTSAPETLARETGLRARAGSLLRSAGGLARNTLAGAAAYGGVNAAVDAYKTGNTDADYQMADSPVGKFVTGGPGALLSDGFAHATSPIRAGMVGAGRRFLSALNPFGGDEAQAATPQPQAAPAPKGPGAPPPSNTDLIDTTRGGKVSAEDMIAGTDKPAYGQGAIKVGNSPASKVGYEAPAPTSGQPGAPRNAPARLGAQPSQPGVFGEIAHMQGLRTQVASDRMRDRASEVGSRLDVVSRGQDMNAETTRRGQDITAQTAAQRLGYEAGKENRSNFDKLIDNHAQAQVPAATSILPGGGAQRDRDASVKQYGADLKNRIEYSLGDRKDGRRMEQLQPVEQNQLFLADAFRRKVEDKRGEVIQSFRDLFGNKRFDSRNLYSYMPVKAESANDGGYLVHFANGNTAKADLVGGEFKFFGPNGPVDADLQQFIAPLIRKARGQ